MQTHIVTVGFDYDYDAAFEQAFATTNGTDSTPRRNSGGSAGPVRRVKPKSLIRSTQVPHVMARRVAATLVFVPVVGAVSPH